MSFRRITISVPEEIAAKAAPLASREPDWAEARAAVESLRGEGEVISGDDRAWARAVLGLAERSTDAG